jgi:hypothetical protein
MPGSYPAYVPEADVVQPRDTPCVLALEDRGMASIIQSANRENAYETAWAVYDLTHPPLVFGDCAIIPTICN